LGKVIWLFLKEKPMITLPKSIMTVLAAFMPVFSERIWDWVQVLVVGAILTPKKRTVTSMLQATGLADTAYFQNYHRVLNRASWSSLEVSKILLQLLVTTFVKEQPLVLVRMRLWSVVVVRR